jgi:hypothetical protein
MVSDNVVILGCNGGTDIAYGGGAYVVTAMAKCLSSNGFNVHLISTVGLEVRELMKIHGISLGGNVYTHYLVRYGRAKLPYVVAARLVNRFEGLIRELKPSLIIYNDDVPRRIDKVVRSMGAPRILYVHFPYITRRVLGLGFMYKTTEWSPIESVINYANINKLFNDLSEVDYVITNSQGVRNIISFAHGIRNNIINIYPPLRHNEVEIVNKHRPIFLHAARQDKTFLENELVRLIEGVNKVLPNALFIISRNKSRRISGISLRNKSVFATPWLSGSTWNELLRLSKYYLHFKWFEGLGIATAETVVNGAIPIVYRSIFNGSWTDIAKLCDSECGFSSVDEALDHVLDLESDYNKYRRTQSYLVGVISKSMSYDVFCRSLISLVNRFI